MAPLSARAQDAKVEEGKKLFTAQKCTLCHSVAEAGNKKGPLDGVGAKLTADEIKAWLVTPKEMTAKTKATRKPAMKAYPNLTSGEVDALVAYLHALKQ